MTATTSAPRVDATHPVLAQLVDAASKAFTGSLEVTTTDSARRDLQVAVWMEDGQVVGIHGRGFTPPAAAYVLHKTGYDFGSSGESPFKLAYETLVDGHPLLDADEMDTARRDWAYGLLASALTWERPKVARIKRATTTTNRIKATPWQVIVSDVAARVDGIQGSWRAVCDSLAASGIGAVPAFQACSILSVLIPGHSMFTGTECLDQLAGRTGTSRYVVLEELARSLLSGAQVQFNRVPTQEPLLIPEHWEDPRRGWGTIDQAAAPLAPIEPEIEEPESEVDPHAEQALYEAVERAFASPEPDLDPPALEQAPLPQMPDLPLVPELELEPDPVHVAAPPAIAPVASARELIEGWVNSAADSTDASVRMAIVERLLASARSEAVERTVDLTGTSERYTLAEAGSISARESIRHAQQVLAAARAALEQAETEVAQVEHEHAGVIAAARAAEERAQEAAEVAEDADGELRRLMELVAAAEAAAAVARAEAERTRRQADAAQAEMDMTAGPALAAARQTTQHVRTSQVGPAEVELQTAQTRAEAALAEVQRIQRDLDAATAAAQRAQAIVVSLGAAA